MNEPNAICPLMSTGTDIKNCDSSCKFYVRYFDEAQNKSVYECALVLIAESITHKDLY